MCSCPEAAFRDVSSVLRGLSAAENALERQRQLVGQGIGAQRALVEAEAEVAGLRAEAIDVWQLASPAHYSSGSRDIGHNR